MKIFVSEQVEAQKILFEEKEKELQSPQMQSLEKDLARFNKKIFQLESFYQDQFRITESLGKISTFFSTETYLNNLSITVGSDKEGKIQSSCNLSGYSINRENLLKLKENLEGEESFKEVYFPPADWMNATSINFTISFKLK